MFIDGGIILNATRDASIPLNESLHESIKKKTTTSATTDNMASTTALALLKLTNTSAIRSIPYHATVTTIAITA